MLVEFGAACLSAHNLYLGNGQQGSLGAKAYTVGLLNGYTGHGTDIYGERALVEGREEGASETGKDDYSGDEDGKCGAEYDTTM